jgi:hypothetical protein
VAPGVAPVPPAPRTPQRAAPARQRRCFRRRHGRRRQRLNGLGARVERCTGGRRRYHLLHGLLLGAPRQQVHDQAVAAAAVSVWAQGEVAHADIALGEIQHQAQGAAAALAAAQAQYAAAGEGGRRRCVGERRVGNVDHHALRIRESEQGVARRAGEVEHHARAGTGGLRIRDLSHAHAHALDTRLRLRGAGGRRRQDCRGAQHGGAKQVSARHKPRLSARCVNTSSSIGVA